MPGESGNDVGSGVQATDLSRRFDAVEAVSGVALSVPPGRLLALLGPNGAGKTTTVRMLAALLRPSAGRATVAGHDVVAEPAAVRRAVGLVMDQPGLYEQMTAPRYLHFFGELYDVPGGVRTERIDALLKMFELDERTETKIGGFSRGMKQKLALARALIHDPPVLFLDEPTGGLDPASAKIVRDYIVQLKASSRAIILCTHDLDEAERLADEVAIIRGGRIVARGTPQQLRAAAGGGAKGSRFHLELVRPAGREAPEPAWGLPDVEVVGVERTDGAISVEFVGQQGATTASLMVRRALEAGWLIGALIPRERSLEEVYLQTVLGASPDSPLDA